MLNIFLALRRLLEWLGLWKDEKAQKIQSIKKAISRFELKLKQQQDKLKDHKRNIENTQESLFAKEKERNSLTGELYEIATRELATLLKHLDSYTGARDLLFRNIDSINTLITKFNEFCIALESDMDSEAITDIYTELQESIQEVKAQDREMIRLETTGYTSTSSTYDVEAGLGKIHQSNQQTNVQNVPVQNVPVQNVPVQNVPVQNVSNAPVMEVATPEPAPTQKDIQDL